MEPTINLDTVIDFIYSERDCAKDLGAKDAYQQLIEKLDDNRAYFKLNQASGGFGSNIYDIRMNHGESKETFAKKIGVKPGTITYWEHDRTIPSDDALSTIASIYKVDVDYLLGEKRFYQNLNGEYSSNKKKRTLKGWRKAKQRALAQIEEECGLSADDVYRIEADARQATVSEVMKYLKVLGIETDDVDFSKEMNETTHDLARYRMHKQLVS